MQNVKRMLLILIVALFTGAQVSMAQIYIRVRPERPHYERVVAPSPRHVWIEEEWEPRGGQYVFSGGRWAEPPRPRAVWVAGHWRQRPRGWVWVPGHWR